MCNNILNLVADIYTIFTVLEMNPDPDYDPDANKPWWELMWNAVTKWLAGLINNLVEWFNDLPLGCKIYIVVSVAALLITLSYITGGASGAVITLICSGAGAFLGGYTACQNNSDIVTGSITGLILGCAVGITISLNGAYLMKGLSSIISRSIADLVDVVAFGGEWGSWKDYALAFAVGGLTGGFLDKLGKAATFRGRLFRSGISFGSEVIARPALSQCINIGLGESSNGWDWGKYAYEISARALTYFIPGKYKCSTVLGEISINPLKAMARGIARGAYPNILTIFENL